MSATTDDRHAHQDDGEATLPNQATLTRRTSLQARELTAGQRDTPVSRLHVRLSMFTRPGAPLVGIAFE
ncbi:MAG: hypothetical protein OEX74_16730 [Gammaproteobacteria bacterium]|nr:hypothetical protein [Gammaproteobacteria bacterium]